MLNVLRGGTLYGDLAAETGTTIQHLQPNGPTYDSFRHPINVHPQTPLAEWRLLLSLLRDSLRFQESLDHGEILVNSYHHQARGRDERQKTCNL